MTSKRSHLKLHVESHPETRRPQATQSAAVEALCRTFTETTGWRMSFGSELQQPPSAVWSMPLEGASNEAAGRISLSPQPGKHPAFAFEQVRALATGLGGVLGELQRTKQALWEREAELAAGVPIAARPQEERRLAERLESVLRGGTDAVGCQAAGLYLLDDATTELKLRAAYNLPRERFCEQPRSLKGSLADLEALVGHAVVLEDTSLLPNWRSPESAYPAAVCVPVATSTTPLGTLWMFADRVRDFTEKETNLVEITAGRLASDLEREMLLQEGVRTKKTHKQLQFAAAWQKQRLPNLAPQLEGWQIAGWTEQAEGIGGDFHDWSIRPDGRLAFALGSAQGDSLRAAFISASLQGALRSHADYVNDVRTLLARTNETLWTSSAGDEFASLAYGIVSPENGKLEIGLAGNAGLLVGRARKHEFLAAASPALGADPDHRFRTRRRTLACGDLLVAVGEGVVQSRDEAGRSLSERSIPELLRARRTATALETVDALRNLLEEAPGMRRDLDRSLLVVKRTR